MSAAEVIALTSDIGRITNQCTTLVGLHLGPDSEAWGTGVDAARELVAASLALAEVAQALSRVAQEVEGIAADQLRSLDDPQVAVNGVVYKPRKLVKKEWHEGKVEDAKRELRQALVRTVGVSPATGDLDETRCDLVLRTLTEFDKFQTISPRSFKTSFYRDNDLSQDEFYESHESFKLEAVPT